MGFYYGLFSRLPTIKITSVVRVSLFMSLILLPSGEMLEGFFSTHDPHSFMSIFPLLHWLIFWFELVLTSGFYSKRNNCIFFISDGSLILDLVISSDMGCYSTFFLDLCSSYSGHDFTVSPVSSLLLFSMKMLGLD